MKVSVLFEAYNTAKQFLLELQAKLIEDYGVDDDELTADGEAIELSFSWDFDGDDDLEGMRAEYVVSAKPDLTVIFEVRVGGAGKPFTPLEGQSATLKRPTLDKALDELSDIHDRARDFAYDQLY